MSKEKEIETADDVKECNFVPIRPRIPSLFRKTVLIFDIDAIILTQLGKAGIKFKIKSAFESTADDIKYIAILGTVPKSQLNDFMTVMKQAPTEMLMHGYTDYASFFKEVINALEENKTEN